MHEGGANSTSNTLAYRPRDLTSCFARALVHCDKKNPPESVLTNHRYHGILDNSKILDIYLTRNSLEQIYEAVDLKHCMLDCLSRTLVTRY